MFVKDFNRLYNEKSISKAKELAMKFSNGVVAAATATALGGEIGVLTARAAQVAHQPMIDVFSNVIGKSINNKYNYFVNDAEFGKRISFLGRNTALKKLHILVEYATGFRLEEDGSVTKRKAFGSVKFYDDETKNLVILDKDWDNYISQLKEYLVSKGKVEDVEELIGKVQKAKSKIKVLDIKNFDSEKLLGNKTNYSALVSKIKNFMKGGKIHFFDLDGTVFTHSVKMFINKEDKTLFAITQEEFAEGKMIPKSAEEILSKTELEERSNYSQEELNDMLKQAMKASGGYSIDFKYFRDPDAIRSQADEKNLEKKPSKPTNESLKNNISKLTNYSERWIYKDGQAIHIKNSKKLLTVDPSTLTEMEKEDRKKLLHAQKGWHGYSMTKNGNK
jgi:hypothetical protein